MMYRMFMLTLALLALGVAGAWAQASTLVNPTPRDSKDEIIRLKTLAPGAAGTFIVKEEGTEIPYQVEAIDGKNYIWVSATLAPMSTRNYEVVAGTPKTFAPKVTLKKEGDCYTLSNANISVMLPAVAGADIPGPITSITLPNGTSVGGSFWKTSLKLKKFTATVIGDGTVLAKVRLRYDFDGMGGLAADIPAFAEVDVALGPGWNHAQIFERHEMTRFDYWEFNTTKNFAATQGISMRYSGGMNANPPAANRELKPVVNVSLRPDLYINLVPRWNQHFKEGWAFGATDNKDTVGAMVVSASKWIWPYNNLIECIVKDSGDYAGLRCSTWKGQRYWFLLNSSDPMNNGYVQKYAYTNLDKMNQEFILEWPGKPMKFWTMNNYDGSQTNPTGGIRGAGRGAIGSAGNTGDYGTMMQVQLMLHPDSYGSYWNHFSPENPNFFTDFNKVPIALTAQLRTHPQFETFRKAAEMRFREDLYNSITMPGGAGQECPGYMEYALNGNLVPLSDVCAKYLGFDPRTWDSFKTGQNFILRISQPNGADKRQMLFMGDTHPGEGAKLIADMDLKPVKNFRTEELPGFGAIFNNNPGTDKETYLSFKSGPNRGHYHGDQLSFQFNADAHALAVDHHCSYGPRSGQEHMHNRVAFWTDDIPYANMDGYERLIGFKTNAIADIAVGQVESERLRQVKQFPPELWDSRYPQIAFDKPLTYRRTVVFVKGGVKDYVVFRDQYWADRPLNATFALHVPTDTVGADNLPTNLIKQDGAKLNFDNGLELYCAAPAKFEMSNLPWTHSNGGRESTQGARLTIKNAASGEFITVLYPGGTDKISTIPGGVKVGNDEITFAGTTASSGDDATYVTVKRDGNVVTSLVGKEINMDRSQGQIGLFIPDAGYVFGEIPDWLARQRATVPDWAQK